MRRLLWLISLSWLAVSPVRGDGALPLELTWEAPSSCPTEREVRRELDRIARPRPGSQLFALRATAHVRKRAGGYALELTTEHDGTTGRRALSAQDCASLVRTVTLVLALSFGPGVEVTDSDQESSSDASILAGENIARTSAGEAEAPAAPPSVQEPRALQWALSGGLGVGFGIVPGVAYLPEVGAELSFGALSIPFRLGALGAPASEVRSDVEARYAGGSALLQGCRRWQLARAEVGACGGAQLLALHGRSRGVRDASALAPWPSLRLAATATLPGIAAYGVRVEAGLHASLFRPRFVIEGLGEVHRVTALVPMLTVSFLCRVD